MSHKWAMLVFACESADYALSTLLEALPFIGLSLEFPASSAVKVLDESGEQHDYCRSELVHLLQQERSVTFQWWRSDSEDLCSRIRLVSAVALVDFYLDGLEDSEEEQLLACVRRIYDSLAKRNMALGLVIDFEGDTSLYDWLAILDGSGIVPGDFPDVLVVPQETGERLIASSACLIDLQESGEQLILRRRLQA